MRWSWIHHSCISLLIISWSSCSGEPQVLCPSQTVQAMVGHRVILPCQVLPPVDMSDKRLEWSRTQLDPSYVHLRSPKCAGECDHRSVNERYLHSTSVFEDELSRGNVSLELSSVDVRDQGTFQCYAPQTAPQSCSVKLVVVDASRPSISVTGITDGGLTLMCDSGCWYPEPELTWLDGEGNVVPSQHVVKMSLEHDPGCPVIHAIVTVRRAVNLTCRVSLPQHNLTYEAHSAYSPGPGAGQAVDPRRPQMDKPALQDNQGCGLTRAVIICSGVVTASTLLAVFWFCHRGNKQRKQWPWLCQVELPGESLLGVSSTTGLDTDIVLAESSSDGPVEVADGKRTADQVEAQQSVSALAYQEQTLALQRVASSMESMQSTWTHMSAVISAAVDSFTAKNI